MRQRIPRVKVGLAVVVFAVVGMAGVALACTPKPQSFALDAAAGPKGEQVTVSGQTVPMATVGIRWDTTTGPVLAETTAEPDGSFAVPVEVPAGAEPGVGYLVGSFATYLHGQEAGVARAAFEVTDGEQAAVSTQSPWNLAQDPTVVNAGGGLAPLSTPLVAGLGMLSVGLVGLFAGVAMAAVGPRRALARQR